MCIPRALLESNEHLINLLLARKMLKPIPRSKSSTRVESSLAWSLTTSSNKGSAASVSMKLSTSQSSSTPSNTPGSSSSTTISRVTGSGNATVISDNEDDSDIEFGDIHPMLNYQRILQQRAQLSSSPAFSAGSRLLCNRMGKGQTTPINAETMSSPGSPSIESTDEVKQHLNRKVESQMLVTIYVFTKV